MLTKGLPLETILAKIYELQKEASERHKLPVLFYAPEHDGEQSSIFGTPGLKNWFRERSGNVEFDNLIKEETKNLTDTNSPPPRPRRTETRAEMIVERADHPPAKFKEPLEVMTYSDICCWLRKEYVRVHRAAGGRRQQMSWQEDRKAFRPDNWPAKETGFPDFEDVNFSGKKKKEEEGVKKEDTLNIIQVKQLAILALRAQGILDPAAWVMEGYDEEKVAKKMKYKARSIPDVEHLLPADDPEETDDEEALPLEVVLSEEGGARDDEYEDEEAVSDHLLSSSPDSRHSDQSAPPPPGSPDHEEFDQSAAGSVKSQKNRPPAGVSTRVQSAGSSHHDPARRSQRPKPFPSAGSGNEIQGDEPATPNNSPGTSAAGQSTPTSSGPSPDSDSESNTRTSKKGRRSYRHPKRVADLTNSDKSNQSKSRADRANNRDKNIRTKSDRGSGGQHELSPVRGRHNQDYYNKRNEAARKAMAAARQAQDGANEQRDVANNNSFSEENNSSTRGDQQ